MQIPMTRCVQVRCLPRCSPRRDRRQRRSRIYDSEVKMSMQNTKLMDVVSIPTSVPCVAPLRQGSVDM